MYNVADLYNVWRKMDAWRIQYFAATVYIVGDVHTPASPSQTAAASDTENPKAQTAPDNI